MNPLLATDAYKVGHGPQYPEGTEFVYSNLTARGSRIPDVDAVVFFGLDHFVDSFLIEEFDRNFFHKPKHQVVDEYAYRMDSLLGPGHTVKTDHIGALHDLGYLPLIIKAVPEGTRVPLRVPMLTVENTHPDFFWLTNYIETILSASLWQPITSATLAYRLRKNLDKWAEVTGGDPSFVPFQGHDFSMRGMAGVNAAALSGAAHLLSFYGSDTIPAMELLDDYYGGSKGIIGCSVAATEHSVMCAGGALNELDTFQRLLDLYPAGIVSVVSDTWDLWHVLTSILPALKPQILARDGKLVIRPDSGDPVDILCGDPSRGAHEPAYKGVIELLWDEFGGTVNEKGFKVLDSHIGAIYGDAITYDRADEICARLCDKGFASTNVVLGVGSYTYQYVTRDTFMMAMKATWVQVKGGGRNIYKDPVTDTGTKKSATGRLSVRMDGHGEIYLIEDADLSQQSMSILKTVFVDGNVPDYELNTLDKIRGRLGT